LERSGTSNIFKSYSQELHGASKESWSDVTFSSFQSLLRVISMLATHLKVMSFNWIGCPARAKTVEKNAADSKWGQFWKPLEVFHGFPEDFAAAFLKFFCGIPAVGFVQCRPFL